LLFEIEIRGWYYWFKAWFGDEWKWSSEKPYHKGEEGSTLKIILIIG